MASGFWDFSCAFYAMPGVAEACLDLQHRHGSDVNLLLFGLWAAHRGKAVKAAEVAEAEQVFRAWRDTVIAPLRAARTALRTPGPAHDPDGAAALRRAVLAAEPEAERLQQETLAGAVDPPASERPAPDLARDNLAACATGSSPPADPARVAALLDAFRQFGVSA